MNELNLVANRNISEIFNPDNNHSNNTNNKYNNSYNSTHNRIHTEAQTNTQRRGYDNTGNNTCKKKNPSFTTLQKNN